MDPLEFVGQYARCKVFTHNIEEAAIARIYSFLNCPVFEDVEIRVMPDVHEGKDEAAARSEDEELNHPTRIEFCSASDPYGVFSNFYPARIRFKGKSWPTTEHAFQAMKFATTEPEWADAIRQAPRSGKAATMGRDRKHKLRPDWESIKDNLGGRRRVRQEYAREDLDGSPGRPPIPGWVGCLSETPG